MVIVAGHITVDPEQRETYLAGSVSVVERARRADGCLDFAARGRWFETSRAQGDSWEDYKREGDHRGADRRTRGRGRSRLRRE